MLFSMSDIATLPILNYTIWQQAEREASRKPEGRYPMITLVKGKGEKVNDIQFLDWDEAESYFLSSERGALADCICMAI